MKTLGFLVFAILMACCSPRAQNQGDPPRSAPTGQFTLISLNGRDLNLFRTVWIHLSPEGELTGWSAVNNISSRLDTAAARNGRFDLSPIIATRMAGPPEQMRLETEFLEALDAAAAFDLSEETLTLRDSAGSPVAVFHRHE